jgi:hypothetical protein
MHRTALFLTMFLSLLVRPVVAGPEPQPQSQTVRIQEPAFPPVVTIHNIPMASDYRPFSATAFGAPCKICPDDIIQRALSDCFLLSAAGAVAAASPGYIERAIVPITAQDQNGNSVYSVRLDLNGRVDGIPVSSQFPAQSGGIPYHLFNWWEGRLPQGLVDFVGNLNDGNFRSPLTPYFFYAQPPKRGGAMWPQLLEKAYVLTLPGGYKNEKLANEGGKPMETMRNITGYDSDYWNVNPGGTPTLLLAFTVHDSPSVADNGYHSIVGGLLRGDLRAIQPNLQVCVTPSGDKYGSCATPCHESHQCQQAFEGGGVRLNPKNMQTHVDVYDVNGPNVRLPIASGDLDPNTCKDEQGQQPCTINTANGPLIISFMMNPQHNSLTDESSKTVSTTAQLDAVLTSLTASGYPIVAGTIKNCHGVTEACAQYFGDDVTGLLEYGHAYIFKSYDRASGVIHLRDPHGWNMDETLDEFLHRFVQIAFNKAKPLPSQDCGCNAQN